jgi:hypothetical protein
MPRTHPNGASTESRVRRVGADRVSVSTTVDASPTAVYALVSDVTRYGEWSPENVSGVWQEGVAAGAVGSRFKGKNKRRLSWTTTSAVTKAEPGKVFEFETGKGPDTRWRYDLRALDSGGTEVTETMEIVEQPGAFLRFLTKLATGLPWDQRVSDLERGMRTTLDGIRATVGLQECRSPHKPASRA